MVVGASCAFLTSIGHQNNTLEMDSGAITPGTTGAWGFRSNC